jgi:hypothetical protein
MAAARLVPNLLVSEFKAGRVGRQRKLGEFILAAGKADALAKPPGGFKKRPRKDRDKNNPTLAAADKNLAHAGPQARAAKLF